MTEREVIVLAKQCGMRVCSTEEHHGCPYGDESMVDCVERLEADYEAAIDRMLELAEAKRNGRLLALPDEGYTDKDGEYALKSAMNTVFYHNTPVTRYIADAVAEKLAREGKTSRSERDG